MTVPDFSHVVRDLAEDFGPIDSHEKCGEFTGIVAFALHQDDPNFGHLKKKPGQTQYDGRAADGVLYKATGQFVDILQGSKIASPKTPAQPSWQVHPPAYTAADWLKPESAFPEPVPRPKPHVCPELKPAHSYTDTLSLANEIDAAYRGETGRTVHPEPLAHWIWRYQFERFTRDDLIADARARGQREA